MTLEELQEKVKQNPSSPLFARLAGELFDRGNISQAREICLKGIKLFPAYTTAHFILAKTYAAEGDFASAASSIKTALKLFPDSVVLQDLYKNWIQRVDETKKDLTASSQHVNVSTISPEKYSERLPDDWRIMTKSLAEVYVEQALFKEAIQTYEGLKILKPAQRHEWEERIKQIQAMITLKASQGISKKTPSH